MRNPGSNTVSGNVVDKFLSLDERLILAPDRYRNWRGHERMHTHLSLPEPGRNRRTGDTGGTRRD